MFSYEKMLQYVNFLRSLYLTKRNPYAMLVKVASNLSIYKHLNLYSHHIEYIQILYRYKNEIKNSFIFIKVFKI